MKVLGVGLGRTGTTSLAKALRILGYRTLHWAPNYLRETLEQGLEPDLRRYAQWDAVTDIPAALYFREFLAAFPECKFILTVRSEQSWIESIRAFYANPARFERLTQFTQPQKAWLRQISVELRKLAYGSERVLPSIYLKRFRDHNDYVRRVIPADRLLVMDLTQGDGWNRLCPFLNCPLPSDEFPRLNIGTKQLPEVDANGA